MIRIRTGQAWRHDPSLREALRERAGVAALVARAAVDAVAIEVDGFDIAGGRAEGELLPALEGLLRAVGRIVSGDPVATVTFRDGTLELVLRRREQSALLTVVELAPPSRVLARDVEVDLDALASAAIEASADFLRDLAALTARPAGREGRALRAAARDLRRAGTGAAQVPPAAGAREEPPPAAPGRPACRVHLHDDEDLLRAYPGGRPDVGSLLAPGRVELLASDGRPLAAWDGMPFLALRDLGAASSRVLGAVRAREEEVELRLPRGAGPAALLLDIAAGTARTASGPVPCPALSLVRAIAEAAAAFGRLARRRNPRQGENGHLAELEASAADRHAQADELDRGEVSGEGAPAPAGARPAPAPQRPLGPGRLRRLSFRRTFEAEVGPPAGIGLVLAPGRVVVTGQARLVALDRLTGVPAWEADGAEAAWGVPGGLLVHRAGALALHAVSDGALLFSTRADGGPAASLLGLAAGPLVAVEAGSLTGLDPGTGWPLWRFEPPGAHRLAVTAVGPLAVVGADTGVVYGLDGGGRTAFRVLGPGPVLRPPALCRGACLVTCAAGPGAALLALDPASGRRLWEAPLDFVPSFGPIPWGHRLALGGGLAGEPIVAAIDAGGGTAWVTSPPLSGAPTLAAAGAFLVARGPDGALVALGRDGRVAWSRAALAPGHAPAQLAPQVVRSTVLTAGEGISVLDARSGEPVGAIPGLSPAFLSVDAALSVVAVDAEGQAASHRLATHLSVVG
jgi:outer membrane protein assembly factor BamB